MNLPLSLFTTNSKIRVIRRVEDFIQTSHQAVGLVLGHRNLIDSRRQLARWKDVELLLLLDGYYHESIIRYLATYHRVLMNYDATRGISRLKLTNQRWIYHIILL